jgi:hypothetical protein
MWNIEGAEAAEFALKAYSLEFTPECVSKLGKLRQQVADSVDLTEAPEDAVCSLVIDLMHYCNREKIDWTNDIVLRAGVRFQTERTESRA